MIPKFRALFDSEMYDMPIICDGDLYLDYSDFLNGDMCNSAILMKSTGKFDKNGKEVYELDIVKMNSGELRLVEVKDGKHEPICHYPSDSFEVVGNIFENTELLEGVEDDT